MMEYSQVLKKPGMSAFRISLSGKTPEEENNQLKKYFLLNLLR
jgi:hypothetical protein